MRANLHLCIQHRVHVFSFPNRDPSTFPTGLEVELILGLQIPPAADVPLGWHWAERCDIPFEDPVELPPIDSIPPELEEKFSLRPCPDLRSGMPEELRSGDEWEVVQPESASKDTQRVESLSTSGEEDQTCDHTVSSPVPSQSHLIARAANPVKIKINLQKQSPGSSGNSQSTPSKGFQGFSFFPTWRRR